MGTVLLSLTVSTFTPVGCPLFTLHLIYYQISYYITLWRHRMKRQLNELGDALFSPFRGGQQFGRQPAGDDCLCLIHVTDVYVNESKKKRSMVKKKKKKKKEELL